MRDDWVTRVPDLVVIVRDATTGNRQEESWVEAWTRWRWSAISGRTPRCARRPEGTGWRRS